MFEKDGGKGDKVIICLYRLTLSLLVLEKVKILRKILNFILQNPAKQIVPCESTAKENSFEWSHHSISSTDSKVRTTLHVSA